MALSLSGGDAEPQPRGCSRAQTHRAACLALLLANVLLLFLVCRVLGASPGTAAAACFLHGYHYGFWALYYNTGTCYDILAFFFYFLAFAVYVFSERTSATIAVGLLLILALNSKEMAVSLPVALLLYELIWRPPSFGPALRRLAPLFAIAGLYIWGRFGGDRSLDNLPSYTPHLSVAQYWTFLERTFPEVFYAYDWPQWAVSAAGSVTAVAIVALFRDRAAAFGLILFAAGVGPIAFIEPRSLYASYIPLAGLAITYAVGLDRTAQFVARLTLPAARPALLALTAGCVLSTHLWVREHGSADEMMAGQAKEIASIRSRLRKLVPDPAPGSRILLLEDPFLQSRDAWFKGWASVFLVELMYDDVHVDQRFRMGPPPDAEAIRGYDYVLTSRDARLELVCVE